MKIVHISDTHGHPIKKPLADIEGNLLIHSGDGTGGRGTLYDGEVLAKDLALYTSRFDEIIYVPGNHDFCFERNWPEMQEIFKAQDIILLNDSGYNFEGVHIWGSPIQPWFHDWAFNRHRGDAIKKHWDMIPDNTNILVTHGPVYGILDETNQGQAVGCFDLKWRIARLAALKLHLCGHIHESYGTTKIDNVTYSNASLLDTRYKLAHAPNIFEWKIL